MDPSQNPNVFHATTIVCVRRGEHVASHCRRRPGHAGPHRDEGQRARCAASAVMARVLAGFAGAAADAFTPVRAVRGQAGKAWPAAACCGRTGDWRTERRLGKLEALLAVADKETSLIISGTGDVIEPEDIIAIGSGGSYALSAARA